MERWPDLLGRTYDVVRGPVALLDSVVLDRRTPCIEWTVRDLFDHLVEAVTMFTAACGAPAPHVACLVEGTPVERFDAAVERNLAAWGSVESPTDMLTLSFGNFSADFAAGMNQLDTLVHGWDIAAALGVRIAIPDDLVESALQTAHVAVPPSRGHVFGAEVSTASTAPLDKLVALTGRDPAAWPGAIWVAGSLVTIRPTVGDPGRASAVEIWEREGSGPSRHVHAEHDEIWYVLAGTFTFAVGDREYRARTGDVVVGPHGVPHTFRAETPDARVLDIHSPGGFDRFFVQAGRPAAALVPPAPETAAKSTGPGPTLEAFGVTIVGPRLGTAA